MNAKEATFGVLDKAPNGYEFNGASLRFDSGDMIFDPHYIATYLRYMREYRQTHDCKIVCVNKRKSLYRMER